MVFSKWIRRTAGGVTLATLHAFRITPPPILSTVARVPRMVLASRSPARLATLSSAGVRPDVLVSGVDEEQVLADAAQRFGDLDPVDAVLLLAQAKAEDVASALESASPGLPPALVRPDPHGKQASGDLETESEGDRIVVGCDSMLEIDGVIYGKPADADEARERWRAMRGGRGVLHTGHWIVDLRDDEAGGTGATLGSTSSTTVWFADLDDAEIDDYVATGEPLEVAGAFTIDGLGGPYVDRIEGDHHGVVGLSLPLLRELLGEIGVPWRELRTL